MINYLDKDSKILTAFCLSVSKADFKDLFWEKQSLFIMTFIRERSLSMAHIGAEEILSEELKIP